MEKNKKVVSNVVQKFMYTLAAALFFLLSMAAEQVGPNVQAGKWVVTDLDFKLASGFKMNDDLFKEVKHMEVGKTLELNPNGTFTETSMQGKLVVKGKWKANNAELTLFDIEIVKHPPQLMFSIDQNIYTIVSQNSSKLVLGKNGIEMEKEGQKMKGDMHFIFEKK